MTQNQISERPHVAKVILAVGVVLYWLISLRAIGRRGYPEIDPFWVALPMLWFVPLALAQFYVTGIRRHWRTLIAYAVLTALIHAGAVVMVIPHHPDPFSIAMITVTYAGPLHCAGVFIIASICQFALRWVRRSCVPVRATVYSTVLISVAVALPLVYRHVSFASARNRGEVQAQADWQVGKAVWYIHKSEQDYFSAVFADGTLSPASGLPMQAMHGGPLREEYYRAYRAVIQKQLDTSGLPAIVNDLFTPVEIQALIDDLAFSKVESFPFTHGSLTFTSPRSYTIGDRQDHLRGTDFVYTHVLTNRNNILIVATDNDILSFSAEGTLLQCFDNYEHKLEVTEDRLRTRRRQEMPNKMPRPIP